MIAVAAASSSTGSTRLQKSPLLPEPGSTASNASCIAKICNTRAAAFRTCRPTRAAKRGPRRLPDHGQAARHETGEPANRHSLVLRRGREVHRVDFTHGCIVGLLERVRGELGEASGLRTRAACAAA